MSDEMTITMLPAKEGDCLHVAYGDDTNKKHILIDAGRQWTYKNALKHYLQEQGIAVLELLVITHVDRDHIDGMLALVSDPEFDIKVKHVWFNTWDHLIGDAIVSPANDLGDENDEEESFGAKMGEVLSSHLIEHKWPWNTHFNGFAVEVSDIKDENIFSFGDLSLTLLSPDRTKLQELKKVWKKECEKAGITPGATVEDYVFEEAQDQDDDEESFGGIDIDELAAEKFKQDHSTANGSSIAFILEYKGKKALLSGDAHVDLLVSSLRNLGASESDPIKLNLFKVPHHGSKYNISNELLDLMHCEHYLISTNGNYFKHPEDVGMARLIKYGTAGSTLHFNYKTEFNSIWKNARWQRKYKYQINYPLANKDGYLSMSMKI